MRLNGQNIGWTEKHVLSDASFDAQTSRSERAANILEIRFGSPILCIRARTEARATFAGGTTGSEGCSHIRKEQMFLWMGLGSALRHMRRLQTDPSRRHGETTAFESVRIRAAARSRPRHAASIEAQLRPRRRLQIRGAVCRNDRVVAEKSQILSLKFQIPNCGGQTATAINPSMTCALELVQGDEILDRWSGRIGLRTIVARPPSG